MSGSHTTLLGVKSASAYHVFFVQQQSFDRRQYSISAAAFQRKNFNINRKGA
jgi:hypothetical protein